VETKGKTRMGETTQKDQKERDRRDTHGAGKKQRDDADGE
jgi:hypothetical protein